MSARDEWTDTENVRYWCYSLGKNSEKPYGKWYPITPFLVRPMVNWLIVSLFSDSVRVWGVACQIDRLLREGFWFGYIQHETSIQQVVKDRFWASGKEEWVLPPIPFRIVSPSFFKSRAVRSKSHPYKLPCVSSRASSLRKSTHPRRFCNHVTVHRTNDRVSVRTTGKPMFTLTLSCYSLSQNGWDTLGSPCPLNVGVQDLVTKPR